jgi:hypothetical protein
VLFTCKLSYQGSVGKEHRQPNKLLPLLVFLAAMPLQVLPLLVFLGNAFAGVLHLQISAELIAVG